MGLGLWVFAPPVRSAHRYSGDVKELQGHVNAMMYTGICFSYSFDRSITTSGAVPALTHHPYCDLFTLPQTIMKPQTTPLTGEWSTNGHVFRFHLRSGESKGVAVMRGWG